MEKLFYTELKTQEYLSTHSVKEAQMIFSYRTRMAQYGDNYRGQGGPTLCPLCGNHSDNQHLIFYCTEITGNIKIEGNYNNIFSDNILSETVKTLSEITKHRQQFIDERKLLN